ncbi:hypothetical protein Q1695_000637 [Nippostrongylus brasiliensis]|nr:hypothetical protein Q1695_000637 [Nippostrongylus brasiliensis]
MLTTIAIGIFCSLVHLGSAQSPKDMFDSKAKALGITFYTKAEISSITDCVDDYIYDLASMDTLKDKGMDCLMKKTPPSKYSTLISTMASMDQCLKPENINTIGLINKSMPAGKAALQNVYTQIMEVIKNGRNAGKSKADVRSLFQFSVNHFEFFLAASSRLSKMDQCLKPENINTIGLINKSMPAGKAALQNVYTQIMEVIKNGRNAGKSKADVLNDGYATATNLMTMALIDSTCKTIVSGITKLQWSCTLANAKNFVDFSKYSCSTIVKN